MVFIEANGAGSSYFAWGMVLPPMLELGVVVEVAVGVANGQRSGDFYRKTGVVLL